MANRKVTRNRFTLNNVPNMESLVENARKESERAAFVAELAELLPDESMKMLRRLANALHKHGIKTASEIEGKSTANMMQWINFGDKCAEICIRLGAVDDRPQKGTKRAVEPRRCSRCGELLPGPAYFRLSMTEFGLARRGRFYGEDDTGGSTQVYCKVFCRSCAQDAIDELRRIFGD